MYKESDGTLIAIEQSVKRRESYRTVSGLER